MTPCRQGYKCVWGAYQENKVMCMLPRCQMYVGPNVAIDRLTGRIAHNHTNTIDVWKEAKES